MRLSDTDKLYKKLSPIQAATMAFEANVRRDDREMDAIIDCQPQLYFVGASDAYRRRFMKLTILALFYAGIYWRSHAVLLHRISSYDESAINKTAALLGSLELALVETCRQLAVSVESVKSLGAIPEEDAYGEFADEALTAEYTEIFMSGM